MIDIEKIKHAALNAAQGEWCFGSFSELLVVPIKNGVPDKYDPIANLGETAIPWDQDSHSAERYRNAEHIATANPSTVLELITRLEAAESQLETIARQAESIRLKDAALDWCIGEFNLRLDDIDLSQETISVLSARHIKPSPEILQARDERVAEACAKICSTKGVIKYAGLTIGEQCARGIRSGEWRKYL